MDALDQARYTNYHRTVAPVAQPEMSHGTFCDLVDVLKTLEDQREAVSPSVHFSEWEHTEDQLETILTKLEDAAEKLRLILKKEAHAHMAPRVHAKPVRPAGHGPEEE